MNNTQRTFVIWPLEITKRVNTSTKAIVLAETLGEMNVTTAITTIVNMTQTPTTTFREVKDLVDVTQKSALHMQKKKEKKGNVMHFEK